MESQPDKTLSGTASVRLAPLAEYTDGSPETSSAPHEPRATRPRHYVRSAASFITSGTPSTSEEVSAHTHRRIIHVRRPRGQRLPPLASTLTAATTDVSQREGCGGDDGENVSGAVEEDDDDDDDDGLTPAAVPRRPPRGRSAPADRRRRRQRLPHHRGTTPELTRGRSAREDALCRAWGHFLFGAVRELVVVDASGAAVGGASASASSSSSWRMWDPWAKSGVKDEGVAVVRLRVPLSCCWNIPRPTALMEMEEGSDWSSECTGEEEGSSSSDDEGSVVGGSDVVGLWRQRFDAHASVAASQPGCFRLYCGSRVVSARLLSDEGASPCTWSTNVGWRVVSEVVGNGVCGEVP